MVRRSGRRPTRVRPPTLQQPSRRRPSNSTRPPRGATPRQEARWRLRTSPGNTPTAVPKIVLTTTAGLALFGSIADFGRRLEAVLVHGRKRSPSPRWPRTCGGVKVVEASRGHLRPGAGARPRGAGAVGSRYCARPPSALERLKQLEGQVLVSGKLQGHAERPNAGWSKLPKHAPMVPPV